MEKLVSIEQSILSPGQSLYQIYVGITKRSAPKKCSNSLITLLCLYKNSSFCSRRKRNFIYDRIPTKLLFIFDFAFFIFISTCNVQPNLYLIASNIQSFVYMCTHLCVNVYMCVFSGSFSSLYSDTVHNSKIKRVLETDRFL